MKITKVDRLWSFADCGLEGLVVNHKVPCGKTTKLFTSGKSFVSPPDLALILNVCGSGLLGGSVDEGGGEGRVLIN